MPSAMPPSHSARVSMQALTTQTGPLLESFPGIATDLIRQGPPPFPPKMLARFPSPCTHCQAPLVLDRYVHEAIVRASSAVL